MAFFRQIAVIEIQHEGHLLTLNKIIYLLTVMC